MSAKSGKIATHDFQLTFDPDGGETFGPAQVVVDGALDLLVVVAPGDVVDLEVAPHLVVLLLVVNVPDVTVDRGGWVGLRKAPVGGLLTKNWKQKQY